MDTVSFFTTRATAQERAIQLNTCWNRYVVHRVETDDRVQFTIEKMNLIFFLIKRLLGRLNEAPQESGATSPAVELTRISPAQTPTPPALSRESSTNSLRQWGQVDTTLYTAHFTHTLPLTAKQYVNMAITGQPLPTIQPKLTRKECSALATVYVQRHPQERAPRISIRCARHKPSPAKTAEMIERQTKALESTGNFLNVRKNSTLDDTVAYKNTTFGPSIIQILHALLNPQPPNHEGTA